MIFGKSEILGLHLSEAVRVKVMICQGCSKFKWQKFSLDPQITSFDLLRILLARAFNITGEFSVSYFINKEVYLPIASDWDLDVAVSEASKPYLQLRVEKIDVDKALDEWDIITPCDIPPPELEEKTSFAESILNQVGKTVQKLQRALSFDCSPGTAVPEKQPMTSAEFENFLDSDGVVVRPMELHMSVYQGGIEPQLRPLIWKHLLNVFPEGLNFKEREDYLHRKSEEYYKLRHAWQSLMHENMPEALRSVTTLVRKDVRRTDRIQKFYSGSDDNKNVLSLFNILTTYGVNHQFVSYCQGMSDILSPILFVMDNEAHAYICFCGLMKRMEANFRPDGRSMKLKFRHLRKMLRYYDSELFVHLKQQDALDLLFCYRWLVLELKREFRYKDALHMLEVSWGSLPPKPQREELDLFEVQFPPLENVLEVKSPLTVDNLIWIDNHFGQSPNKVRMEIELSVKKWSTGVRRESKKVAIEDSYDEEEEEEEDVVAEEDGEGEEEENDEEEDDDDDEEDEVDEVEEKVSEPNRKRKFSIHWYIQKLGKVSESLPSRDIDTFSCEVGSNSKKQESGICQSWPFIMDMVEKQQSLMNDDSQLQRATYHRTDVGHNQWCYSNTLSELQRIDFLRFQQSKNESDEEDDIEEKETSRHRHGSNDSNNGSSSDKNAKETSRLRHENNDWNYGRNSCIKTKEMSQHRYKSNDSNYDTNSDINAKEMLRHRHESNDSNYGTNSDKNAKEMSRHRHKSSDSNYGTNSDINAKEMLRHRHGSSDSNYGTNSDYMSDCEFADKTDSKGTKFRVPSPSDTSDYASGGIPFSEEAIDEDYESGEDFGDGEDKNGDNQGSHCVNPAFLDSMFGKNYEEAISYFKRKRRLLPPPHQLGDGNPFLLFLCMAMILQQRDAILRRNLEYNELGMYFDKLVRKHNVKKVLCRARTLFAEYLNLGWHEDQHD